MTIEQKPVALFIGQVEGLLEKHGFLVKDIEVNMENPESGEILTLQLKQDVKKDKTFP